MPARNGGATPTPGFHRVMAIEMDQDPAEWPCNTEISYSVARMERISWGPYAP